MDDLSGSVAVLAASIAFVVGVAMAGVAFAKQFGARGKACLAIGMGLGLALGVLLVLAACGTPRTYSDWLLLVVVALICACSPSGAYELWKKPVTGEAGHGGG